MVKSRHDHRTIDALRTKHAKETDSIQQRNSEIIRNVGAIEAMELDGIHLTKYAHLGNICERFVFAT